MKKLKKVFKQDLIDKTNVNLTIDCQNLDYTTNKETQKTNNVFKIIRNLAIALVIIALVIVLTPPAIFLISTIKVKESFKITKKDFSISELNRIENNSFKALNEVTFPSKELKNLKIDNTYLDSYQEFAYTIFNNSSTISDFSYSPMSLYSILLTCLLSTNDNDVKNEIYNLLNCNDFNLIKNNYLKMYQNNYFANDSGTIQMYNSIFLNNDYTINTNYIDILKNYYIEAFKMDFNNNNDIDKMLSWIDQRLQEKNFTNKEELQIDDNVTFYLFNTLYFNNKWLNKFNNKDTYQDIFYNQNKKHVKVSYMNHSYIGKIYDYDSYISCYDYYENKQKIQYIVPKEIDNNLKDLITNINFLKENEDNLIVSKKNKRLIIDLSVPKFQKNNLIDLTNTLKNLGVNKMFDEDSYAFNHIYTNCDDSIYCKFIKQKNILSLDEDGTTIKSLSMAKMGNSSAGKIEEDIYEVKLNQPFIYVIYDQQDLPIYIGQVDNL